MTHYSWRWEIKITDLHKLLNPIRMLEPIRREAMKRPSYRSIELGKNCPTSLVKEPLKTRKIKIKRGIYTHITVAMSVRLVTRTCDSAGPPSTPAVYESVIGHRVKIAYIIHTHAYMGPRSRGFGRVRWAFLFSSGADGEPR